MTEKKLTVKDVVSKLGALLSLVLLCAVLSVATNGKFLRIDNLLNILRQVPIVALMACGMLCVILLGGIDLSSGSSLAISTCVAGVMMKLFFSNNTLPNGLIVIVICLVTGILAGTINGLLLTKLHLPHPFISTLGTKLIFRGLSLLITGAAAVAGFPKAATFIGYTDIGGSIPVSFVLTVVVFVVMHIFLSKTPLGRKVYSYGGNKDAARLAGINTDNIQIMCYALSGFFCALAGVVYIGRMNSAVPLASLEGSEDAIASCIIGGASFMGGKGNVWGTLIGAFMITVIRNGCTLLGISNDLQQIVIGLVIVAAVYIDVVRLRSEAKKKRLAVAKANG